MSGRPHERPPFRAEHLGSLLRPTELLDIRHKIDKFEGKPSGLEKDLEEVEDTAVKDIVKTQIDLGFHPISDGEY
jgi:methionine synthase II (cobalamin-independent)